MPRDWGPVRPITRDFAPQRIPPFDSRSNVFIPDRSITDEKVQQLSPRKLRLIGARVYNSATQSIADDGAAHSLSFDTVEYEEGGDIFKSTANTKLTIPYQGVYQVTGFGVFVANATGLRRLRIYLNNTTQLANVIQANNGAGTETPLLVTVTQRFAAGDYVELQARQDSGGGRNIDAGASNNSFTITYLGTI